MSNQPEPSDAQGSALAPPSPRLVLILINESWWPLTAGLGMEGQPSKSAMRECVSEESKSTRAHEIPCKARSLGSGPWPNPSRIVPLIEIIY
jgi:hypothetical protein